jgi:hypothetical protein
MCLNQPTMCLPTCQPANLATMNVWHTNVIGLGTVHSRLGQNNPGNARVQS